jgi:hypothetical protein
MVLGMPALTIFSGCVTMAMLLSHMVAFSSDISIGPNHGTVMLTTQLTIGFLA